MRNEPAVPCSLSPAQAERLRQELLRLSGGRPSGRSLVLLNEKEARRPGGGLSLRFDARRIEIPEVAPPERWLADPAPILFLLTALWKVTAPMRLDGPPPITGVLAVVDLLAAGAYTQAQPGTDEGTRPVVASFVSGALYSVATGALGWKKFIDNGLGEPAYPVVTGVMGFTAVSSRYWDGLSSHQRLGVCLGTLVLLCFMMAASPKPVEVYSYLETALTAVIPLGLAGGAGRRLAADAEEVWELLSQRSAELINQAYRDGADEEVRLLAGAIDASEDAVDELGDRLTFEQRSRISSRFEEAREWLAQRRA